MSLVEKIISGEIVPFPRKKVIGCAYRRDGIDGPDTGIITDVTMDGDGMICFYGSAGSEPVFSFHIEWGMWPEKDGRMEIITTFPVTFEIFLL